MHLATSEHSPLLGPYARLLLRLTWVEANVDLKDRRAKVPEGRLQENKGVGGFRDSSWQRLVA